ncbi:MAG: hypothetical protein V1810_02895 [Candidatus Beckwithbacteria bacterium]
MATNKIDWSQGVDFSPLEKLGVDKMGAIKLLAAMTGLIDLEFRAKIKGVFSQEELKVINEEAAQKGIKPEDGLELIEEKYQAKTGNYFIEEIRLLYNQYVVKLAEILTETRRQAGIIGRAGKAKQQELEKLIMEKKYEAAGKLMEALVKEKNA